MIPLILPARYAQQEALEKLRRPQLSNFYGLWLSKPARSNPEGVPSSIELIWLPSFAFRVRLTDRGRKSEVWVAVDATYGGFSIFGRIDQLVEQEPVGQCFPVRHPEDECRSIAREGLIKYLLRRRGKKPSFEAFIESRHYCTPVWAYYFRRGRKLDFAVLDAYSGEPAGGRLRQAVINGLIALRK